MNALPSWCNPALAKLPPRVFLFTLEDARAAGGAERFHLLHLNESPYPPSPRLIEAVRAAVPDVHRYPATHPRRLAAQLGERIGVAPERLLFGDGSDEILHLCAQAALGPGSSAVVPTPSFPRYRMSCAILSATPIMVRIAPDGTCDERALLAAIRPDTRALFVCTPNNPSGGAMSAEQLDRLVAGCPDDLLLVVDEAYHEFGRAAGTPDVLAHLKARRGPWAVSRTFSKAFGMAGMRLGYLIADSAATVELIGRTKASFNVNTLALVAAEAALADEGHLADMLARMAAERERLAEGLRRLQFAPLPSVANFVSADLGRPAIPVMEALQARGVLAREWRDPGYETYLRITIGTAADTDAALAALRAVMQ